MIWTFNRYVYEYICSISIDSFICSNSIPTVCIQIMQLYCIVYCIDGIHENVSPINEQIQMRNEKFDWPARWKSAHILWNLLPVRFVSLDFGSIDTNTENSKLTRTIYIPNVMKKHPIHSFTAIPLDAWCIEKKKPRGKLFTISEISAHQIMTNERFKFRLSPSFCWHNLYLFVISIFSIICIRNDTGRKWMNTKYFICAYRNSHSS